MDTHVNTEEENISEMGAYCSGVDDQTRPAAHNFKRTSIESLPDDVVVDILARVPARDILCAARLVCHKWYQTTRTHVFVRAHLQQSTCGLLIQQIGSQRNLFATQKGPIIEKSDFDYKLNGYAFPSCNGLVLEIHDPPNYAYRRYRITNPTTKQHFVLPSMDKGSAYFDAMGLAYAVASKEFKAVRTIFAYNGVPVLECAILAVGVDEDWKRRVDIQHLSPSARNLLNQTPRSTDGFVHWAQNGSGRDSEYVLTLNIETEIITQFPAVSPSLCGGKTKLLYCYLPMGSCLSLLIARDNEFPTWDQVWVMKPETGEWTKTMSIDSESQKRALQGVSENLNCRLYPVGWLKFREVLVFCDAYQSSGTSKCVAYNVRTHEIESLELGFRPYTFLVHRNSLLWLDGC